MQMLRTFLIIYLVVRFKLIGVILVFLGLGLYIYIDSKNDWNQIEK